MLASLLPSSWFGRAALGLAVWTAVVLAWGLRPMTDHVPLVPVADAPEEVATQYTPRAQSVSCNTPLSGSSSVRGEPPALEAYLTYTRPPCRDPLRSAQRLLIADLVLALAAGAGLMWYRARQAADVEANGEPASNATASPA